MRQKSPRISINKLAEFTIAKGARQRTIIRDQKYPDDFKRMYYKEASEPIAQCISHSLDDISFIHNRLAVLEQMNPEKVGTQRRINANIDALETFEGMLDLINFHGATPELGASSPPKLVCRNVEISVRPEIILRSSNKKGKKLIGAVKLYFSRSFSLNEDAAGNMSAVLQEWSKTFLPDDGIVSGPLCFVIDIGAKTVWPGVKATAQRMKDVEANCQTIADLWPNIKATD